MPIPTPKSEETEQEFVSRCIGEIYDEYGQEQSAAICYNTYRSETNMTRESKIVSQLRELNYRGIDLTKLAEDEGLEGACWDGYVAIGMKELDGRMVPNCVPIKEELKGVKLEDYPWDECIADQMAKYENEETAQKICGWIKSNYGS